MVLVLSLPEAFPYRDQLVSMTFGVAVLSILLQGLTMSRLLGWLGIVHEKAETTDYEIRSGRLQAAAAALQELAHLAELRSAPPAVIETLQAEYARRAQDAEQALHKLALSTQELQSRDLARIRRDLLDIERDRVMQSFRQGVLGRNSQQRLLEDIDARLSELETDDEAVVPDRAHSNHNL
jgi:CPA1 family monovalent cation:H+ antiporter